MRLSMDEVRKQHESTKKLYEQGLTVAPVDVKRVLDLYDTIEALQQENEQLKADCDRMLGEVQELTMEYNHFKERLQISPYGDDKIDELDEALENCKFQYEQLKQENEQLRAQVARTKGNLCLLCVGCEAEPENGTIECNSFVCRNKARCHNPNDVEALRKAREALEQTKGFIKGIGCYCNCEGEYASQCQPCFIVEQIDKTLTTIDKAIGGKEDV